MLLHELKILSKDRPRLDTHFPKIKKCKAPRVRNNANLSVNNYQQLLYQIRQYSILQLKSRVLAIYA